MFGHVVRLSGKAHGLVMTTTLALYNHKVQH